MESTTRGELKLQIQIRYIKLEDKNKTFSRLDTLSANFGVLVIFISEQLVLENLNLSQRDIIVRVLILT